MKKASAFFMGSPDPPPGPMQNADAFCMGTRPLRASPCGGGDVSIANTPLAFRLKNKTPHHAAFFMGDTPALKARGVPAQ